VTASGSRVSCDHRRTRRSLAPGAIDIGGGKDLFSHRSTVEGARFEELRKGQRVSFTEGQSPKGPRAEKVTPI